MKISDSDIISAARDLRDEQNEHLQVVPNPLQRSNKRPAPLWWAATAAALVIGYIAGMNVPQQDPSLIPPQGGKWSPLTAEKEASSLIHPTSPLEGARKPEQSVPAGVVREEGLDDGLAAAAPLVVHDTIYQTRIVRVPVPAQQVMTAQAEPAPAPQPESQGCSMLCDDIRYDLLAGN